jgi:DNA-binding NtrC family response regulator
VDLVLTDIVMPGGMSGLDLAERLAAQRPSVRVLCMSGYAPDAAVFRGAGGARLPFLQKPFTPRGLCLKVREVLGG